MRADAAENAEHALHEERRLDEAAIDEVRERVEVTDVVALDLEAGAVLRAGREDVLDVLERVLEHAVSRAFEMRVLPIVFERLMALQHLEQAEVHRPHVQ